MSVTATAVPPCCFWFCPALVFPCHCLHLCLVVISVIVSTCVPFGSVFRFLFCVQSLSCPYDLCHVSTLSVFLSFSGNKPFVFEMAAYSRAFGSYPTSHCENDMP